MQTAINNIKNALTLNWLTGPIFDKELRVSSRRKRNYALRFFYITLLIIALSLIWAEMVRYNGPVTYRISQMAEAGMIITFAIIWFQFIATQIVAGVMLSTAISDEIYHKTLGTLMTTPISSFQVVTGKLLSKLLQSLLLVAISFPLLSIIRIFGGIPWNYIVSSIAITIVTIIFVGSLSLFYSIFTRKAYVSMIMTIITLAVIFLLFPFLVFMLREIHLIRFNERRFISLISHVNPYIAMIINTEMADNARAAGRYAYNCTVSCLSMLVASSGLLSASIVFVRKAALRQATGQPEIFASKAKPAAKDKYQSIRQSRIRTVGELPVLWKEMQGSLFGKRKKLFLILIGISTLILLLTYMGFASSGDLDHRDVHMVYVETFYSIGILFTIILPATVITHEKESRSWLLLLSTTLSDTEILIGKFAGCIKRCLPAWAYLFAHLVIFTLIGYIHPLGILQVAIVSVGTALMIIGSGLFFSTIFKRTTTAVITNFIFAAIVWMAIPVLLAMPYEINHNRKMKKVAENSLNSIPFAQVVMSMESTANGFDRLRDAYWSKGRKSPHESTMIMIRSSAVYASIGIFLTILAKLRFRKKIF